VKAKFKESNKKGCETYVTGVVDAVHNDSSITCYNTVNDAPDEFKLLLKPLNLRELIKTEFSKSLNQQDSVFREYFNNEYFDLLEMDDEKEIDEYPVGALKWLLTHHYDVFGLIKQGLAEEI
jgi:hypothetical protein